MHVLDLMQLQPNISSRVEYTLSIGTWADRGGYQVSIFGHASAEVVQLRKWA